MTTSSLFSQARLKLTLYYILIFLTISSVISGLFYYRTSRVLEAEYDRIERRFQLELRGLQFPQAPKMFRRIHPEDLNIAKRQIIFQLLRINGVIVILVAATGYILSGITLAPIEASMRQQKRFISDIAHEIKTPLTALKTSLEVSLMDDKLPPSINSLIKENLADVTHLDELTTSMLKLTQNHQQPLASAPVYITAIIHQAIRLVSSQAKSKHITINTKISGSAHTIGDKAALTDVIKILLDNAIKYSPEKTTITVATIHRRHSVDILIKDQGYGIPASDLPHIFDRFYRVDTARTNGQTTSGYGLGLSIAKSIVDYHRGKISVKSKPGFGTTFTLTFPLSSQ